MRKEHLFHMAGLVALVLILRFAILYEPLGPDAGVFCYGGWRVLEGEVPYQDFWDNKPPGIFAVLAGFQWVAGSSVPSLRLLEGVLAAVVAVLFYFRLRRYFSSGQALGGSALFAWILNAPQLTQGGLLTETYAAYAVMAGYLVLWKWAETHQSKFLFIAGLAFGLAFHFKGSVIAEACLAAAYLAAQQVVRHRRLKPVLPALGLFAAGPVLTATGVFLIFAALGAGGEYSRLVYWSNIAYVRAGGAMDLPGIVSSWFRHDLGIFFAGALAGLWVLPRGHKGPWPYMWGIWLLGSAAAASLSGRSYGHYYIEAAAPLGVLSALGAGAGWNHLRHLRSLSRLAQSVTLVLFVVLLMGAVDTLENVFQGCRGSIQYLAGHRPVEGYPVRKGDTLTELASMVKDNTLPEEPVFIWGYGTPVYYLSQRRCSGPWIYVIPDSVRYLPDEISMKEAVLGSRQRPEVFAVDEACGVEVPPEVAETFMREGFVETGHYQVWGVEKAGN